ncbi:MAG: pilus assembly protein [Actinobacteria bacterium]|nr:pilus assembly protein [Actinomycetota bacterium]
MDGAVKRRDQQTDLGQTDRGAALVEFAILLPILVLVLISIFEIGAAFRNYLTVSYPAREGARMSAFLGTNTTPPARWSPRWPPRWAERIWSAF